MRGGRHRKRFTLEREAELFKPFLEYASIGGILVVSQVKRPTRSGTRAGDGPVIGVQIAASAQLAQTRVETYLAITEYIEIFYRRQRKQVRLPVSHCV